MLRANAAATATAFKSVSAKTYKENQNKRRYENGAQAVAARKKEPGVAAE